jgi:ribosome-associated toxin RatA of RatAB toxin-antitoxin module
MKRYSFLSILIFLFHSQLSASGMPDRERLERLGNGEILLLEARTDESGGSARVQAIIHAPAKAVWDVIMSCEQTFTFVKGLKKCEVVEDTGDRALIHQVVKTSWLVPTQDFVFESLRDPYHGISFQLVEGNLKAMKGRWQLTERPDGLLVDYEIRIRPGYPVPAFIVSWVIRRGMPDLIACIRGLAGGSGSMEQVKEDLDRCQGTP